MSESEPNQVAIVITCFRQARFLNETITSIQGQTYKNWQAIVVVDNSPNGERVCDSLRERNDTRIKLIRHHMSKGIAVARNIAIGECDSAMFVCLHAGDYLEPSYLDRLVPQEQVRDEAIAYAREIAENAPLALMTVRKSMRGDLADAVKTATDQEGRDQFVLQQTSDHREGVKAVAERRPGNFTGS